MSRRRDKGFETSALLTNLTFLDFYYQLKEIAISRFVYYNYPATLDVEYLERKLYELGKCAIFRDEVIGDMALACATIGHPDVNENPIKWAVYGSNGYYKNCDKSNSVIMYNNRTRRPTKDVCLAYAKKLYLIDRTEDININAQKTPILIKASETQRLTMLQLYQKYDGNQPYIFADRKLNLDDVSVLQTNAPFVTDKIHQHKMDVWNECLTYLGITNVSINKRERLITDEVTRSQGGTLASRAGALGARQKALDYYNAIMGTNIVVEFNPDYIGENET